MLGRADWNELERQTSPATPEAAVAATRGQGLLRDKLDVTFTPDGPTRNSGSLRERTYIGRDAAGRYQATYVAAGGRKDAWTVNDMTACWDGTEPRFDLR